MRTLVFTLNNSHISTAVSIILIMLCIKSLVFICLITGSLCLLTAFIQFHLPPSSPGNHNLISFPVSLFVCFWNIIDLCQFLLHNIVIQYFYTFQNDLYNKSSYGMSPYKGVTQLLTIFPTLYISYLWHLFCNGKFVPLNLPHIFLSSPHPASLWQPPVLSIYNSVSVMFVNLFWFLDSICKWNHIVFVFLWLTYFT